MATNDNAANEEEIDQVRGQEQAHTPAAKRAAAEKKRRIDIYSKTALRAKKAKDARAFAQALRTGNVPEGSEEWKKAWKYFSS